MQNPLLRQKGPVNMRIPWRRGIYQIPIDKNQAGVKRQGGQPV